MQFTGVYSDVITISENDDVHVYTDMYDADCNDCGATRQVPDRPVDPDDNSGTGNGGTGNSGADNNGTGNSGAGNNTAGNGGEGNNSANKAPNAGDCANVAWLMAIAVAAMAGSMLVSLKKKRA